ncbi:hypothetical protein MTR67_013604 [Solanum verrucosum]|uniref:Uncharacterized protein n=1 Tax=Solanum verrucosum TaxID=315347 RepID=A0AAF0QAR4_SOLVR|nr:hypothetical protein MTR67_013604 [Solanum verrucosum]
MFLQFVLAFSAYLHVLGTQFSQKFSSQCSVVQVLSIQITLRSVPDLQFSRISDQNALNDSRTISLSTAQLSKALTRSYELGIEQTRRRWKDRSEGYATITRNTSNSS